MSAEGHDVIVFGCPGCGELTDTENCYNVDLVSDPHSVTEPQYCHVQCYINGLLELVEK